ncbi:MAG: hypothetical protein AB7G37_14615 [Solirubrobacteraceae bacterium]
MTALTKAPARAGRRWGLGAVVCGAAIVGGLLLSTGAEAEDPAPATSNVAILTQATPLADDDPAAVLVAPARSADPHRRDGATLRGVTAHAGTSAIELVTDEGIVCAAPRVAGQQGAAACAPLPLGTDAVPFQIGTDDAQAWVAAVVPDGVARVTATGDTGRAVTAEVQGNVAIPVVSGAREIERVSWETADGRRFEQVLGQAARAVE